jgi:multicomponent Na+:H+ antiporter subunit F
MSGSEALDLATLIGLVGLGLSLLLTLARLVIGPTSADRILALDLMTVLGMGFIAVLAMRTGLYIYLDIAIALALMGFLATVAFARYLWRRSAPRRADAGPPADTEEA